MLLVPSLAGSVGMTYHTLTYPTTRSFFRSMGTPRYCSAGDGNPTTTVPAMDAFFGMYVFCQTSGCLSQRKCVMVSGGVKVDRTDSLADPDWRPVAKEPVGVAEDGEVEIAVHANVSSGFYRLQSKGQ